MEVVRKMRKEATSLHGAGPPPSRAVRACGHLVRLPDSVFVRSTPSGLEKIIIYTSVWSDPCITQISSVFRFEPVSVADLDRYDFPKSSEGQDLREGHQSLRRGSAATPSIYRDA